MIKKYLRYLLFPFSIIYAIVIVIRNLLYDLKIFKSKVFNIPIIGIGNLSTGGSGKTPMAEYIIEFLTIHGYIPALLSRGYGRNTKGFLEVKQELNAEMTGDEPFQIKHKFPDAMVAVCEDRVEGVESIMQLNPKVNVIVLDDSFQHRKIKPGFNILLTEYMLPYYKNNLLPVGTLREPSFGRKRADVVILTKCPDNISLKSKNIQKKKLKIKENQSVFYTMINYKLLKKVGAENDPSFSLSTDDLWQSKVVMFTGIANVKPLEDYLENAGVRCRKLKFPDHYRYSDEDIEKILKKWRDIPFDNKLLITTEKDWRRIEGSPQAEAFSGIPLYFLPISVRWNANEKPIFDKMLLKYVESGTKSH